MGLAHKVRHRAIDGLLAVDEVVTLHLNIEAVIENALRESEIDLVTGHLRLGTVANHQVVVVGREEATQLVGQELQTRSSRGRSTQVGGRRVVLGHKVVEDQQVQELHIDRLGGRKGGRDDRLRLGVGIGHHHRERYVGIREAFANVDAALDRHRTVNGHIGRTLQEGLNRGLELVEGVDIESCIHRVARPLNERAILQNKAFRDEVLQREVVATLRDGIVAIHLEGVGLGDNLQAQ